jgi:hypothetical protein
MNKKQIQQRVLQDGKPLALDKFEWDEKAQVFSTTEYNLVLDFTGIDYVTFKTDSYCTFNTGSGCTFKTSSGCTFKTDSYCTFNTGSGCTFKTGSGCTFDTGSDCMFNTSSGCTFKTGSGCTFDTGSGCTFKTGSGCVVIRRDIYAVIELIAGQQIKLNEYSMTGYTVLDDNPTRTVDDILSELSDEDKEILKSKLK